MSFGGSGSSGNGTISGNSDVILNNAADGNVLAYNGTTFKWTNLPLSPVAVPKRVTTLSYASTITPNCLTTDIARITLLGSATIATPSGTPLNGQQLQVHLIQDNTGNRTVSWSSTYAFSSDIPSPTLSTAGNSLDICGFQYDASRAKWLLLGIVKGF